MSDNKENFADRYVSASTALIPVSLMKDRANSTYVDLQQIQAKMTSSKGQVSAVQDALLSRRAKRGQETRHIGLQKTCERLNCEAKKRTDDTCDDFLSSSGCSNICWYSMQVQRELQVKEAARRQEESMKNRKDAQPGRTTTVPGQVSQQHVMMKQVKTRSMHIEALPSRGLLPANLVA